MLDAMPVPNKTRNKSKVMLTANIALGLVLWFGLCTGYSWDNAWANVIFPPLVGILGLVSFFDNRKNLTKSQKNVRTLLCLPSIIGGAPYLLLIIIAVIPPFLLATLFWFGEQGGGTMIQRIESPSGMKTAEVYFLPVGPYSGGNGRIEVHLKSKWLPFAKRDVYFLRVSHANENTHNYLSWTDDETLFIPETNEIVNIRPVEWRVPAVITVPINIILFLVRDT